MNDDFNQKRKAAQGFIQSYLSARQCLTDLGVLRSERGLQGDYAEWLVANMLGLRLVTSTVEKAIDATDKNGRSYQIKSRIVKSLGEGTSFDFATIASRFDFLVCVFFSPELHPLGIARVPYEVVRELGVQNINNFRFRWNKRTASDIRIEKLFWAEKKPKARIRNS